MDVPLNERSYTIVCGDGEWPDVSAKSLGAVPSIFKFFIENEIILNNIEPQQKIYIQNISLAQMKKNIDERVDMEKKIVTGKDSSIASRHENLFETYPTLKISYAPPQTTPEKADFQEILNCIRGTDNQKVSFPVEKSQWCSSYKSYESCKGNLSSYGPNDLIICDKPNCTFCGTIKNYKAHLKSAHSIFLCSFCNEECSDISNLNIHKRKYHGR